MIRCIATLILHYRISRYFYLSIRNIFIPKKINEYEARLITIEPSSICDAKCIFCNYKFGYRKKITMSKETFQSVAQSCFDMGYNNLNLTSVGGEFLTNPHAVLILEGANQIGFRSIAFHTNGILLYRHDVERLLKSGLGCLLISTPGFSKELYIDIFGVDKYDEFKKSVILLLEIHKRINSKVLVQFCPRTYLTIEEIKKSDFYKETISKYISDVVSIDKPVTIFDSWNKTINNADLKKGMTLDVIPIKSIYPLKKLHLCGLMEQINILSNGDVRLCNCRYDKTISKDDDPLFIDNISKYKSLSELLEINDNKIKKIKDNFINGNLSELCRTCSVYRPVIK